MEDGSGRENQSQILNSCECQGGSLDLIPPALLKRCEPLGVVVRTTITVELPGGSVVCTVGGTRGQERLTQRTRRIRMQTMGDGRRGGRMQVGTESKGAATAEPMVESLVLYS